VKSFAKLMGMNILVGVWKSDGGERVSIAGSWCEFAIGQLF